MTSTAMSNSARACSRWPTLSSRSPASKWFLDASISAAMGSGAGAAGLAVTAGRGAGGGTAAAAGLGFEPHPAVRAELIPTAARAGSHARDVILGAPAGIRHQRKRLRRVEIPCDLAPV